MKLLRHVDLSFNELTDVALEIFAKFLERCPNLESLNLQGNVLGAASAELLSSALAHSESLKYLNLQYNKWELLAPSYWLPHLEHNKELAVREQ